MNRTLRLLLLIVVAVVQLAVAGDAIVRYELTLRYGESLRFRVQPIDPVDSFRGRYVALTFEANRAEIPEGLEIPNRGWIFVPVVVGEDGFARLGAVSLSRPSSGPYLRLRSGVEGQDEEGRRVAWVNLPFRRLYMKEELAAETERAMWRRGRRQASVLVYVRDGVGVAKDLLIEGTPVREWIAGGGAEQAPPRQ
jgi:uncharacterized membrane-anchored protein